LLKFGFLKLDAAMETQLVYLSIPQGSLEKLEIVAAKKGLAVEQVVQEFRKRSTSFWNARST
jgi:hypothetical protein